MKIAQIAPLFESVPPMVHRRARDFDLVHFHIDYLHFPLATRSPVATLTTGIKLTLTQMKELTVMREERPFMLGGTKRRIAILCSMNANQQPNEDLAKVEAEKQPWSEAWEQAWEAYQAQEKPGGDEDMASLRNRAKQENDARYLGPEYARVFQYLPKADRPKAPQIKPPRIE